MPGRDRDRDREKRRRREEEEEEKVGDERFGSGNGPWVGMRALTSQRTGNGGYSAPVLSCYFGMIKGLGLKRQEDGGCVGR